MTVLRAITLVFIFASALAAQDTISLTLPQADSLLISRNLALIASRYEIDMAAAARVQAKLFTNPELSTEWNLYNPSGPRWLDVGSSGQKIIALEKVFQLAGQRRTSIRLADEVKRMTEYEYEALARALRYELHVTFSRYYYLNNAVSNIDSQLRLLKDLIHVYTEQYQKGNISLQELTRLNTTYFNINKQVKDVQQEQIRLQETLKILLSEERYVIPEALSLSLYTASDLKLEELVAYALAGRPEVRIALSQQQQNRLRYELARKEAMPDLTAGILFDQSGSYVNNYTAFTLGMRLPVFNRNQGQIEIARLGIEQGEKLQRSAEQRIRSEVESAWQSFNLLLNQYNEVVGDHEEQLNLLSEGLVTNYSKGNISLLEFTDLFEAYNTNIIQYSQLKADLIQSYEELNHAVGRDISN